LFTTKRAKIAYKQHTILAKQQFGGKENMKGKTGKSLSIIIQKCSRGDYPPFDTDAPGSQGSASLHSSAKLV